MSDTVPLIALETTQPHSVPGTAPAPVPTPKRATARRFVRFILRRPGLAIALVVIALTLLAAVWPSVLSTQDPLVGKPGQLLESPSLQHPFGTDATGRDVYARVVHGAVLSVESMLLAVAIAFAIGGLIGLIAGSFGGWVDALLMRIVDVLLAIPALLLSLAIVSALGYGSVKVAIAVGVASIAMFSRIMRAEVLRVRTWTYIEASKLSGARWYSVIRWHIVPNAIGGLVVFATVQFGLAILAISSLSFLGYGAPVPAPEWGSMIADGRNYLHTAWWLTTLPGLTVVAIVLSTNRIARALDGEWSRFR